MSKSDDPRICRRRFVQGAAACTAFAFPLRSAGAQEFPKMSKQEAGYFEPRQAAARMCGQCVFFLRPDQCRFVEGPISELGTCRYYSD